MGDNNIKELEKATNKLIKFFQGKAFRGHVPDFILDSLIDSEKTLLIFKDNSSVIANNINFILEEYNESNKETINTICDILEYFFVTKVESIFKTVAEFNPYSSSNKQIINRIYSHLLYKVYDKNLDIKFNHTLNSVNIIRNKLYLINILYRNRVLFNHPLKIKELDTLLEDEVTYFIEGHRVIEVMFNSFPMYKLDDIKDGIDLYDLRNDYVDTYCKNIDDIERMITGYENVCKTSENKDGYLISINTREKIVREVFSKNTFELNNMIVEIIETRDKFINKLKYLRKSIES